MYTRSVYYLSDINTPDQLTPLPGPCLCTAVPSRVPADVGASKAAESGLVLQVSQPASCVRVQAVPHCGASLPPAGSGACSQSRLSRHQG